MAKILCTDKEAETLRVIRDTLDSTAHELQTESNSLDAVLTLRLGDAFDVVVAGWDLPIVSGEALLLAAMQCYPKAYRVLLVDERTPKELEVNLLFNKVVHALLRKPVEPTTLLEVLERALSP